MNFMNSVFYEQGIFFFFRNANQCKPIGYYLLVMQNIQSVFMQASTDFFFFNQSGVFLVDSESNKISTFP